MVLHPIKFDQERNREPSRIRTYIGDLEGLCPNPLDDRLIKIIRKNIL